MSDPKKIIEKTEVTTETKRKEAPRDEVEKETTVKTERTYEEADRDPVVIIEE